MLFAALTVWLFVIIFAASGVHALWSALLKPRVVNAILLPGTLVAQLGHVFGLLITGNEVSNTRLMSDDPKGEPTAETPEPQKLPIIGPVLVGLLPIVFCAGCLYAAANTWGAAIVRGASVAGLPQELPQSLASFWDLLRRLISMSEELLSAVMGSDLPNWPSALFLYLAVCLTVRMAPFEGNKRGAIGAIVLAGLIVAIVGSWAGSVREFVLQSWAVLSFAVAMLTFLLLASLLVYGTVGLVRILARNR